MGLPTLKDRREREDLIKMYKINKADWDLFHHKLDSEINVTNFQGNNVNRFSKQNNKIVNNKEIMKINIQINT